MRRLSILAAALALAACQPSAPADPGGDPGANFSLNAGEAYLPDNALAGPADSAADEGGAGYVRPATGRTSSCFGARGGVTHYGVDIAAHRTAQLDVLADLVEDHIDIRALEHVVNHGVPADLPVVTTGLAVSSG